ncbi:GNAT family N-acetyltransferase [Cellulophaga baltica]|uniref:GNAT family N-acetyltransferase n=1 Tax=Cellulophaga TaxID=104264 RepID=UPI001C06F439|nr:MULTISPECIES: GNAT family N-acetyltransferase [Cellulophaga]MBU2996729.1 GNAT family N-acetyltransferase [Cellulophaga baltica]MDO6768125.1 GNAT family N-acetyltransferase [Cellulophaga sp. 1_MG-2023]
MRFNLITNKINSDQDKENYSSYVSEINSYNPFFKIELLAIKTDYQLYYFLFEVDNQPKVLMPFYLRKIEDKPSYFDVISPYGYSGPLFSKGTEDFILQEFWSNVKEWYLKNNVVSEFIRFNLEGNHKNYGGATNATLNNVRGIILNEPQKQWDNFKSKVRNNYRKAQEYNLVSEIHEGEISEETIQSFYNIYIDTMKRNQATDQYFYTFNYFFDFIKNNTENRILIIILKDNTPISVELILKSDDTLYSFLGGTDSNYFECRPNDFLKIEALNWARVNGFKYYVLGGGRKNGDNLYKYKKTFFHKDEDVIYYTGRKIVNPEVYNELSKGKTTDSDFFPLYRL